MEAKFTNHDHVIQNLITLGGGVDMHTSARYPKIKQILCAGN